MSAVRLRRQSRAWRIGALATARADDKRGDGVAGRSVPKRKRTTTTRLVIAAPRGTLRDSARGGETADAILPWLFLAAVRFTARPRSVRLRQIAGHGRIGRTDPLTDPAWTSCRFARGRGPLSDLEYADLRATRTRAGPHVRQLDRPGNRGCVDRTGGSRDRQGRQPLFRSPPSRPPAATGGLSPGRAPSQYHNVGA